MLRSLVGSEMCIRDRDNLDLCPSQPEIINGYMDLDGCPDDVVSLSDADGDGIPDSEDACPQQAEVYNAYMDADGCPDAVSSSTSIYYFPDADGDGIEDRRDQCINEPENFDGFLDADGCPEAKGVFQPAAPDSDYDTIPDSCLLYTSPSPRDS